MSAKILDCKVVAQAIKDECKAAAAELKAKGIEPKLGIFRVGAKGPTPMLPRAFIRLR